MFLAPNREARLHKGAVLALAVAMVVFTAGCGLLDQIMGMLGNGEVDFEPPAGYEETQVQLPIPDERIKASTFSGEGTVQEAVDAFSQKLNEDGWEAIDPDEVDWDRNLGVGDDEQGLQSAFFQKGDQAIMLQAYGAAGNVFVTLFQAPKDLNLDDDIADDPSNGTDNGEETEGIADDLIEIDTYVDIITAFSRLQYTVVDQNNITTIVAYEHGGTEEVDGEIAEVITVVVYTDGEVEYELTYWFDENYDILQVEESGEIVGEEYIPVYEPALEIFVATGFGWGWQYDAITGADDEFVTYYEVYNDTVFGMSAEVHEVEYDFDGWPYADGYYAATVADFGEFQLTIDWHWETEEMEIRFTINDLELR